MLNSVSEDSLKLTESCVRLKVTNYDNLSCTEVDTWCPKAQENTVVVYLGMIANIMPLLLPPIMAPPKQAVSS